MDVLQWQALVDLAVLTAAIYVVLHWSREARALRVTFGILALETGALAAARIDLVLTSWILHAAAVVAAVVLIALFQPELRHALNQLEVLAGRRLNRGPVDSVEAIAAATFSLAAARRGALLVLQGDDAVNEMVHGGVSLGGRVSVEILEAIFRKVSPVHDGATVIVGDQITQVAAILPLSQRADLPREWGTRHRAAMGLAERSDAVVIVASEERGEVSWISDGQIQRVMNEEQLRRSLQRIAASPKAPSTWHLLSRRELGIQLLAAALATAIWATFLFTRDTVQVQNVPIQFTDVPRGVRVTEQSESAIHIRLRGSRWALRSLDREQLIVRVSLAALTPGVHRLAIGSRSLVLPVGVTLDDLQPTDVAVWLGAQEAVDRDQTERLRE